jgi:hypothetical protein
MTCIPYVLVPAGNGWRLEARGFIWYFESRQKAVAFALATAGDYAKATGQPTSVRVEADDGVVQELRRFSGQARRVDPILAALGVARRVACPVKAGVR